jgi:rhamnosyltransferase
MQQNANCVLVVIPTYAPARNLTELLASLSEPVIVSDDASPCTADPQLREASQFPHVDVLRNSRNRGIARGLNQGLRAAQEQGFDWLLTLDQDSQITQSYVSTIVSAALAHEKLWSDRPVVGVIAPSQVNDLSGPINYPKSEVGGVTVTQEVIQSGALWRVSALTQIGGFDERLGIDAVDAAACLHLREAGYLVALTDSVEIDHNLGDSRQVSILGRKVMITNHSPARRATMVRNRLRLAPAEFKQSPIHAFRTLRRVGVNSLLGGITGEDRWQKTKGSLSGLRRNKE